MSDDADISEPRQSLLLANTIKRVTDQQKAGQGRPSLTHCRECGEKIPDKRRLAEHGCELCVKCKSWLEKYGGFFP